MIHRMLRSASALAAGVAVLLLVQSSALGQTATPAAKARLAGKSWTLPRTPDGKPDLQGIYSNATLTPLERPKALGAKEFYTEPEFADLAKRAREGKLGEEADLGVAAEQTLRYDLSLYGFDATK